jgi:flagellum-specific ATP synthase
MPLGELDGIHSGASVAPLGRSFGVNVGLACSAAFSTGSVTPSTVVARSAWWNAHRSWHSHRTRCEREPITVPFATGIRAMDGLLTFGCGQRIGIFAGSGVGKSTLLGMIARKSTADVNVIALVGERNREVQEFMSTLGPDGLARSVVVVATGEQAALVRARCAMVATAIASTSATMAARCCS